MPMLTMPRALFDILSAHVLPHLRALPADADSEALLARLTNATSVTAPTAEVMLTDEQLRLLTGVFETTTERDMSVNDDVRYYVATATNNRYHGNASAGNEIDVDFLVRVDCLSCTLVQKERRDFGLLSSGWPERAQS